MKIGVIGTGNMGSLIINALIKSRSVKPSELSIVNRSIEKADILAKKYTGIIVRKTSFEVIEDSELIFLCIKPAQFYPLLQTVHSAWLPEKQAISITSPITVDQLERIIPCQVARVVPSIVNQSLAGSTLVTFGTSMDNEHRKRLWNLLTRFSSPIEIEEAHIRVASDLSSCGPAFLSFLLEKMIEGAVKAAQIPRETATELLAKMVIGFGRLLENGTFTLQELREKVTVKGGVTGVGLEVLSEGSGELFMHLFEETQKKFEEDHQIVDPMFNANKDYPGTGENSNQ